MYLTPIRWFQTLLPVANPRRLRLWVDYFLRYDETAWAAQDSNIQDDDGDSEVWRGNWGGRGWTGRRSELVLWPFLSLSLVAVQISKLTLYAPVVISVKFLFVISRLCSSGARSPQATNIWFRATEK